MTITVDHIEFYSDKEIDNMLLTWEKYYEAVDSGKDQYVLYPRVPFSFGELRKDRIRRDFLREDCE